MGNDKGFKLNKEDFKKQKGYFPLAHGSLENGANAVKSGLKSAGSGIAKAAKYVKSSIETSIKNHEEKQKKIQENYVAFWEKSFKDIIPKINNPQNYRDFAVNMGNFLGGFLALNSSQSKFGMMSLLKNLFSGFSKISKDINKLQQITNYYDFFNHLDTILKNIKTKNLGFLSDCFKAMDISKIVDAFKLDMLDITSNYSTKVLNLSSDIAMDLKNAIKDMSSFTSRKTLAWVVSDVYNFPTNMPEKDRTDAGKDFHNGRKQQKNKFSDYIYTHAAQPIIEAMIKYEKDYESKIKPIIKSK